MKCQYLIAKFEIIDKAINKAKNVGLNDLELSSMLSSYLVVFISGIYEDIIEYLFTQRAGKNNDKEIENFVKTLIGKQFRNPEYRKIRELVGSLDPKYQSILESKIETKNKEGLNSIVYNKNNVAHGKISNATINDIEIYNKNAIKIFEELEHILL